MLDAKIALAFILGALGGATSERVGVPAAEAPSASGAAAAEATGSGDSCDACSSAVAAGDIIAAARASRKCTDADEKAACTRKVRRAAPGAAKAAAFNNQCDRARAIAAAAEGMGAGSNSLRSAIKTCTAAKQRQAEGDACHACLEAAREGSIVEAAKAAQSCADDGKTLCTRIVRHEAPAAARAMAAENRCGAAKSIAAAARSMGANSNALRYAIKSCGR